MERFGFDSHCRFWEVGYSSNELGELVAHLVVGFILGIRILLVVCSLTYFLHRIGGGGGK